MSNADHPQDIEPSVDVAGHVHPTPAADALEWEQARQAAEPTTPPEAPVAVAADGWTKRAAW